MSLLGNNKKAAIQQQHITTLLSAGTIVSGGLNAPAFARIDGTVNGDVEVAEGLILGETGAINGNVSTGELVVHGTINGNVTIKSIEIAASGNVNGDITTQLLAVATGGIYNGRLVMNGKEGAAFSKS